jgi:hypothetical protein
MEFYILTLRERMREEAGATIEEEIMERLKSQGRDEQLL